MKTDDRSTWIKKFSETGLSDLALVGGKNASLGEMTAQLGSRGIKIPGGFAVTSNAYRLFIEKNGLAERISLSLDKLDRKNFSNLKETGSYIRNLIHEAKLPDALCREIVDAYKALQKGQEANVAVRSSATAEDLPSASFAGQHESFLNVRGEEQLLRAVQGCFASLFTDRAIKYREDKNFAHMSVALSVGVQKMVRSDLACSGVAFTLEPESGFRDIIHIAGCWGLGENIVQGTVNPDEFYVFKPTFISGKNAIVSRRLGSKARTMVYAAGTDHRPGATIVNTDTPLEKQKQFVLTDAEINELSHWCLLIEQHYGRPMDIEWAKDGLTGELFIVQARPETAHTGNPFVFREYTLKRKGKLLAQGNAVGNGIAAGIARVLRSPAESDKLKEGEILITEMTNPDWNPLLKKAAAIVTAKGGRTSHASIVARELGVVAVVGALGAIEKIQDGQLITVSCAESDTGYVYEGKLEWESREVDFRNIKMPETRPMLILGDPDKAFRLSFYPNNGIGLMRLEFIIGNAIRVHPMALVKFDELKDEKARSEITRLTFGYADKKQYFVDKLAEAVAIIACAFYPKEVIVRMSDFKTNEYANLIGGKEFEPGEENPMIGFRGASRYYHEKYREGFHLECNAMKKVREEMGLTNVKLMIPFCRTVEEGKKVVALMKTYGLIQKDKGLEIYMMVEIPSNVILADEFATIFDGFSIGSNDLTQLTLGIDRDSSIISDLFNEENSAVEQLITWSISAAKKHKIKIGLCGQAPSDKPAFAAFLVKHRIDSISFNPDALLKGIENMNKAEADEALRLRSSGFMEDSKV